MELTNKDFYDFYCCSHLVGALSRMLDRDVENMCLAVESFANKIIGISRDAIKNELRHRMLGGDRNLCLEDYCDLCKNFSDREIINFNKRELSRINRKTKKDSWERYLECFDKLLWHIQYGGKSWNDICRKVEILENSLPVFSRNIKEVIITIDNIIDMEHNTDLFLSDYCRLKINDKTVELFDFLNDKGDLKPKDFVNICSAKVARLASNYI